ncbi:PREDICTED: zinc finger protein RFP-like [Gekko japonicus]|uniref:RING-type E3 ubiquitin transferase n=1 Tax=Gekko japonicus TaxID=146911 RepID=A0ABM1KZI1_GEKJA|nr:PREDICTED: zinc finger protein RFP-like [Gekko japonicus]
MAAGDLVKEFCEETTCSVCLEYFRDPVMVVDCGHSFCRACITQYWGDADRAPSCPQCRETFPQRHLRPNRQLANFVELVKKLEEGRRAKQKRGACETHEEPLKLFCKSDGALICVVCDRAKEHREHDVVPVEEAFQELIKAQWKSLEKERDRLVEWKLVNEQRSLNCLAKLGVEKQKIKSIFRQMQTFLEEKEHARLAQLEALENETKKWQEENVLWLSEDISSLNHLISEMEEKCQLSANEFLQDIRSTLSRYEKKQERNAVEFSPGLEERLRICCQKNSALEDVIEVYKEFLEEAMDKVNVTLDPDTAHPELLLPEELKSVSLGDRKQDLPDNPERFNIIPCVLGCERFTSGRHWWEVEVKMEVEVAGKTEWTLWDVGVARESVRRKGMFRFRPDEGVWAVGKPFNNRFSPCQLLAFTSSSITPLTLKRDPRKIRVSLHYEEGRVEFFDADTEDVIFSFPSASFCGEKIRPFFWVGWFGVTLNCSV